MEILTTLGPIVRNYAFSTIVIEALSLLAEKVALSSFLPNRFKGAYTTYLSRAASALALTFYQGFSTRNVLTNSAALVSSLALKVIFSKSPIKNQSQKEDKDAEMLRRLQEAALEQANRKNKIDTQRLAQGKPLMVRLGAGIREIPLEDLRKAFTAFIQENQVEWSMLFNGHTGNEYPLLSFCARFLAGSLGKRFYGLAVQDLALHVYNSIASLDSQNTFSFPPPGTNLTFIQKCNPLSLKGPSKLVPSVLYCGVHGQVPVPLEDRTPFNSSMNLAIRLDSVQTFIEKLMETKPQGQMYTLLSGNIALQPSNGCLASFAIYDPSKSFDNKFCPVLAGSTTTLTGFAGSTTTSTESLFCVKISPNDSPAGGIPLTLADPTDEGAFLIRTNRLGVLEFGDGFEQAAQALNDVLSAKTEKALVNGLSEFPFTSQGLEYSLLSLGASLVLISAGGNTTSPPPEMPLALIGPQADAILKALEQRGAAGRLSHVIGHQTREGVEANSLLKDIINRYSDFSCKGTLLSSVTGRALIEDGSTLNERKIRLITQRLLSSNEKVTTSTASSEREEADQERSMDKLCQLLNRYQALSTAHKNAPREDLEIYMLQEREKHITVLRDTQALALAVGGTGEHQLSRPQMEALQGLHNLGIGSPNSDQLALTDTGNTQSEPETLD